MGFSSLTLDRWRALSDVEQEAMARQVARELPMGFKFRGVELCAAGDRQNRIAFFTHSSATFALIPGAEPVTLGFDTDRDWQPTPEEAEDYREAAEAFEMNQTIHEHVASATLRLRTVTVASFLVETAAHELGWEEIHERDEEVEEILTQYGPHKHVEVVRGDRSVRVRPGPDETVIAERSLLLRHGDVSAQMNALGFRLPTSDEWEYACSGGTTTLFRWGDHVPTVPVDDSTYHLHRAPNAFGLHIATNPYHFELVAEIGVLRGGDGGCAVCGGAGYFLGCLPLATAYFEPEICAYAPDAPIQVGYTYGRRVLSLG